MKKSISPYPPTAGIGKYLKDDASRKPRPGMILKAQKDLSVDINLSILIGNKKSYIKAGLAAGVGTNLLFTSERNIKLEGLDCEVITQLQEAIPYFQRGVQ